MKPPPAADPDFEAVLIGDVYLYACVACRALVWFSDRDGHREWHRLVDQHLRSRKK